MLQNAKTPRPVCDHSQNRELFDSVEQRFGKIIANGLGSLCRIIGLYRELRHLCRGKLILLCWEEFLDQIEECIRYRVIPSESESISTGAIALSLAISIVI